MKVHWPKWWPWMRVRTHRQTVTRLEMELDERDRELEQVRDNSNGEILRLTRARDDMWKHLQKVETRLRGTETKLQGLAAALQGMDGMATAVHAVERKLELATAGDKELAKEVKARINALDAKLGTALQACVFDALERPQAAVEQRLQQKLANFAATLKAAEERVRGNMLTEAPEWLVRIVPALGKRGESFTFQVNIPAATLEVLDETQMVGLVSQQIVEKLKRGVVWTAG